MNRLITQIDIETLNIVPVGRKHVSVNAKLIVYHNGFIRHNEILEGGYITWKADKINDTTAILRNCMMKQTQFTMPTDFYSLGFVIKEE